jgi:RNA polymerase primary sigma factor
VRQAISRAREREGTAPEDVQLLSLDAPASGESTTSFGELLEDEFADDPEAIAEREDMKQVIERHLSSLEPPTRRAVRLRYGLETGAPETIERIARSLSVDALEARRLTARGLRQLQREASDEQVEVLA